MKFNINNYVKVKLTDIGKDELKKQWEKLHETFPSMKKEIYKQKKEDENGFSKWQMHDIINRLGHLCNIGFDVPFEPEIEIIED